MSAVYKAFLLLYVFCYLQDNAIDPSVSIFCACAAKETWFIFYVEPSHFDIRDFLFPLSLP